MVVYTVTKTLAVGEVLVTKSTGDVTNSSKNVKVTTTKDTIVLVEYSIDSGTTWLDSPDGTYNVDTTTDQRSPDVPEGIMRVTLGNNNANDTNTVTVTITTTSITSGTITPDDVYRTGGINSSVVPRSDVLTYINRAESEVLLYTGLPLSTVQETREYFGNNKHSLLLDRYPIITLDSLTISSTSITTSRVDVVKETGTIILETNAEATRFTLPTSENPEQHTRNISATYTWGYDPPLQYMLRLAECLAAIMMLTQQTGGTYNDITNYSIGDYSASLGEPWTNINRSVQNLKEEVRQIIANMKKAPAVF